MKVLILLLLLRKGIGELMIRCDFTVSKKIMSNEEYMSKELMEENARRQQKTIDTMKKITVHKNLGAFRLVRTSDEIDQAEKNQFFKRKSEGEVAKEMAINPAPPLATEDTPSERVNVPANADKDNTVSNDLKSNNSETQSDLKSDNNDSSNAENEYENDQKPGLADLDSEVRRARKTLEITKDDGINHKILSQPIDNDLERKHKKGEITARVKKVNSSSQSIFKERVLTEQFERLLSFDSGQKNLYFDIDMTCEYISENNSNSLRYKSHTKLTCDSKKTPIMNFILVDTIISNKETVNLRKMMRYRLKDKGHYIAYIADRDFYPKIQTISEKCSFIIESTSSIARALISLIVMALLLV